ncbi:hypothetical protein MKX01_041695 [Papaver californicum]|nr:hypothetical protein MKX01_041695 [Papaver californicum]
MATTEQLYQNQKINLLGGSSREIYCEIEIMASSVIHSSAVSAQTPGIFTVKEFQLKDGIGPWMTRVRIAQMWHELDFMKTNDVTSLDLLLIDYDKKNHLEV